jgi:hypothetical protein
MDFDQMDAVQRRLHNCALVLEADGDTNGFPKLQFDAIEYIERLKTSLNKAQMELLGLAKATYSHIIEYDH